MEFVNRNGRVLPVESQAPIEPFGVLPGVAFNIDDDGTGFWAEFAGKAVRIGFQRQDIVEARTYLEFVKITFVQTGNEYFPHASTGAAAHGINAAVPGIKIANDADAFGVGRPDAEMHAANPCDFPDMRA